MNRQAVLVLAVYAALGGAACRASAPVVAPVARGGGADAGLTVAAGPWIRAISAGDHHTCALTAAGGVKCWGMSFVGQLGDGSTRASATPVEVVGLPPEVVSISSGGNRTCALTSAGALWCWGDLVGDRLGDDTMTRYSSVPVSIPGLSSGVVAVSAGKTVACVVRFGGAVTCWGRNDYGQLGYDALVAGQRARVGGPGTAVPEYPVAGLSAVLALSVGPQSACAVVWGGAVRCWGENILGQLGTESVQSGVSTATEVTGLSSGAVAVAECGSHSCAVVAGAVKCWGNNARGQLGNGSTYDSHVPVDVVGLSSGVVAVSGSNGHTCALTASGGVKCWGSNSTGELGNGSSMDSSVPVDVVGLSSGVAAVSAGFSHTCALMSSGAVRCWGNLTLTDEPEPTPVPVEIAGL